MKATTKKAPGSRSPNDTDIAVGIKLRKLRLDAGMTLQELAEQIGVSHQQLQKPATMFPDMVALRANTISPGIVLWVPLR